MPCRHSHVDRLRDGGVVGDPVHSQELVHADPQQNPDFPVERIGTLMQPRIDQMIEPALQTRDPIRELMREPAFQRREVADRSIEGTVQALATLGFGQDFEGRQASGRDVPAQSSIPCRGDDGTPISREGMRPAR